MLQGGSSIMGSSLQHTGPQVVACGLQNVWAQQLQHQSLVATCGIPVRGPAVEPAVPCIGRQVLNHWTAKKVPIYFFNKPLNRTYSVLDNDLNTLKNEFNPHNKVYNIL